MLSPRSAIADLSCPVPQLGYQRLWRWRGWRIRYTFLPAATPQPGPPMLLIHGFGANLNQWRQNLSALSQHHPVYALDLLGFGGSEKAATLYGAQLWAEQIDAFWQQFLGQPTVVLGHSLGALASLTAVSQRPEMAAALIMLTLPAARQDLIAGWLDTLSRSIERWVANPLLLRPLFYTVRRPALLRSVLRSVYVQPERVDQDLIDAFAHPPLDRGAARTLCYLVRSRTTASFSPSTDELVTALQLPTLLLWGTADRVIPYAQAEQIAALSSEITLQPLADQGHCSYDECPQQLHELIFSWLQTHGLNAGS